MLKMLTLLVIGTALGLAAAACGDDTRDDSPTQTPPRSATPGTETPVIIDEIIAAVRSGDPAELEALFVFQQIPCTTTGVGAGGPPVCADGEPDGTLVTVAPMGTCEGFYARPGELRVQDAVHGSATFDAAYEFTRQEFWADASYGVVFALPEDNDGARAFSVMASDDGVIGILYGCGWRADDFATITGFGPVIAAKSQV
jgi:hypothetical protein